MDATQYGAQFPGGTSSVPAERAYRLILLEADGCRQARHEVRAILERAPPRSAACGRSLASHSRAPSPETPEVFLRHEPAPMYRRRGAAK